MKGTMKKVQNEPLMKVKSSTCDRAQWVEQHQKPVEALGGKDNIRIATDLLHLLCPSDNDCLLFLVEFGLRSL